MNGFVYFTANDGRHGAELWRSDGSEVGTTMVADINLAGDTFDLNNTSAYLPTFNPVVQGDVIYFAIAEGEYKSALWRSDGTENGTFRLSGSSFPSRSDNATELPLAMVVGSSIVFPCENGELCRTDGTVVGTAPFIVPQPWQHAGRLTATNIAKINGAVILGGTYRTDGTIAGSYALNGVQAFGLGDRPILASTNQFVLVVGYSSGSNELQVFRTDGLSHDLSFVKTISGDLNYNNFRDYSYGLNRHCDGATVGFFIMEGPDSWALWVSDGTDLGTKVLINFQGRNFNSYSSSTYTLTCEPERDSAYVAAKNDDDTYSYYRVDGRVGKVSEIVSHKLFINDGIRYDGFRQRLGSKTLLAMYDPTTGKELWSYDENTQTTELVRDINTTTTLKYGPTNLIGTMKHGALQLGLPMGILSNHVPS